MVADIKTTFVFASLFMLPLTTVPTPHSSYLAGSANHQQLFQFVFTTANSSSNNIQC